MDRIGFVARSIVELWQTVLLAIVLLTASDDKSFAERLSFRHYGAADGLNNLSGTCGALAGPGYLIVCSEHGVFFYDGRVFRNLGASQGLVDGGVADDLVLTQGGRVAIRFPDRLFVSDTPVSLDRPPTALTFRPVDLAGGRLFNGFPKQMARSAHGLALIIEGRTMRVVVPPVGAAKIEEMGYNAADRALLLGPTAIFGVGDRLWETFEDGRICSVDPGLVHCYSPSKGVAGGPWRDIAAGDGDRVLARSDDGLATIDLRTGSIRVEPLPDQGGPYDDYPQTLGIFRTPGGELVTQSAHGLIIRKSSGWIGLNGHDGIPAGTISFMLVDRSNQLWLDVIGRGLFRGLNYGHWEGLEQDDGLSAGAAWATVRLDDSLWVSTDTGIDEVRRVNGTLQVVRTVSGASYAIASGPRGVWSGSGKRGVLIDNPSTGALVRVATPLLNSIAVTGSRVWLGTAHGLFHVDVTPGANLIATADGAPDQIVELASDGSDGIWILMKGRLWHRRLSGRLTMVSGQWPSGEFQPFVLAPGKDGHMWVGGAGGLYDLTISDDRITRLAGVPQADLRTNTIVACMIDQRGWVWVGTGQGVDVYDGHRWVSTDADQGLVWDDISQDGLTADPDGSIWIATSVGVSHLLDPTWLFSERPVRVAISQATLGQSPLPAGRIAYTDAPLALQFGTVTFASERSISFRYRLSGVDRGWVETATGSVRYPTLPPGRHVLTVVGYDTLSHVESDPVTLVADMAYPWWRSWWADLLYALTASAVLYAMLRLRDRASAVRQQRLEALVAESTRDMRVAQAELKRQATLDGLTGLLNRGAVERRLQDRLSSVCEGGELLVALLDIDHFKRVNDTHGHLIGDELLRAIAIRATSMLRDGDYAGRYGGEEFIIVLDDRDGRGAERILVFHQLVRHNPFYVCNVLIEATCSVGLAWASPGDDWTTLIGRADAALYDAKAAGRDKVIESREDQALMGPISRSRPARDRRTSNS